mmetsp:Transcript_18446/g.54817  ORF Transcript_18446/g.54817 Transcript_18446/m.54817 type:complete len:240 (+) Transcript_18446:116-835(+)
MVARVWLVPYTEADKGRRELLAVCYLEHNQISGALTLDVRAESRVVVDGGAARVVVGKGHTVPFSVAACVGRAIVSPKATGFDYDLTFDGNPVPEVQARPVAWLEPLYPKGLKVEVLCGPREVVARGGKSYYKLSVSVAGGEAVVKEKRFSDFADLYGRVHGAYFGSHLRASVPPTPAKVLNPFFNQLDPDFVAMRQVELNDFIKKLVLLPRALANPALLDFLDLPLPAHAPAAPAAKS